jgi:hypothetical protein
LASLQSWRLARGHVILGSTRKFEATKFTTELPPRPALIGSKQE